MTAKTIRPGLPSISAHGDPAELVQTLQAEGELTVPAEMDAGDVLMFSGRVLHGGGANRTRQETRRGLALPLQLNYFKTEEPFPFLVSRELAASLPSRVQKLIGFDHADFVYG